MKKWSLIIAMVLCVIAIGGLAVVFHNDGDTPSNRQSGSTYVDESYNQDSGGVRLNALNLIF